MAPATATRLSRAALAATLLLLPAAARGAETSVAMASAAHAAGVLAPGQQQASRTLAIDSAGEAVLVVLSETPLTVTVRRPDGVVLDATNAAQYGAELLTFTTTAMPAQPLPGIGIGAHTMVILAAPPPGDYEVRLAAPAPVGAATPFSITLTSSSSVRMGLGLPEAEGVPGVPLAVAAMLFDGSAPIPGALVSAAITRDVLAGGEPPPPVEVVLRDDGTEADDAAGDGIYTGIFTAAAAGRYMVVARADGLTAGGQAFQRQATANLRIADQTARLSGSYVVAGVDDNGNGLFDRLRVEVGVSLLAAAELDLALALRATDGRVVVGNAVAALAGGARSVTVEFTAAEIRSLGADGPWAIADVRLDELTDERILRDRLAEAGQTPALLLAQFERDAIELTGAASASGVDDDGDGRFDVLHVEIEVDLVGAGFHEWSARLAAPGGAEVGFASGAGELPAGVSRLTLDFDGCAIGGSGRDGPYAVTDLLVQGDSGSLVSTSAVATADLPLTRFACAPAPRCVGDCDGGDQVSIDELIKGVNIALGAAELATCPAFDADGDGEVAINELVAAVGNALAGCPAPPSPTPTGERTATATATATASGAATATASATATATVPPATPSASATPTPSQPPPATATATRTPPAATLTATPTPTATPPARVYCDTLGAPLAIPDDDSFGVGDTIVVADDVPIAALRVSLVIGHPWVGDLQVSLLNVETLDSVLLIDRPGVPASQFGCSGDDLACRLTDDAAAPIETACSTAVPAITGDWRPAEPLAAFAGRRSAGTWTLVVADLSPGDLGDLIAWCLEIDAGPE